MTSIDSDASGPRHAAKRIGQRLGHLNARVWPWLSGGVLVLALTFRFMGLRVLAIPLAVLFTFLALGQMALERRHNRRLCEACIAALPLNPSAVAERIRRRLRFVHWTVEHPKGALCVGSALLAMNAVIGLAGDPHGLALLGVMAPTVGLLAGFFWYMFAVEAHRQLAPWCPYCHRGGGGGRLHMPAPGPVDSTGRRR